MEKKFKKWLCVALAVVLMASALPLIAGAIAPSGGSVQGASSTGQAPLKVEIRSDKDKYTLLGKMEFTATITNTSSNTVEDISAQALLGASLRPLAKGSQFTATKASLAPNESFSFTYYADLNGLKSLDNLLLPLFWVSSLLHGGKSDVDGGNRGSDFTEANKTVGLMSLFSGQYDASTSVKVWYKVEVPDNNDITIPPDVDDNHVKHDETTGINYIDNSIIIFFKHGTTQNKKMEIINSINGKITWEISETEYTVEIPASNYQQINRLCNELMLINEVNYASGDTVSQITTDRIPHDPWAGASLNWDENNPDPESVLWGFEAIEALSAWDYDEHFQHIGIGVVDNGFDTGHEDLVDENSVKKIELVPDWMASANDIQEHGTHVAGIIGTVANNEKGLTGIVWNSSLYGVDWQPNNNQTWDRNARILAGLRYCVEAGAKVVNFSLGTSGSIPNGSTSNPVDDMNSLGRLASVFIQQLLQEKYDFLVVQSSGNGTSGKDNPSDKTEKENPENVLAVDAFNNGFFASVTENNIVLIDESITKQDILDRIIIVGNAKRNTDGNYQQSVTSNGGIRVDICAPGTNIYSCVPGGYNSFSGTSMAAPMVTGVAGLVWSVNLNLTGPEVKDIVVSDRNTKYKVYDNPDDKHTTNDEYRLVNAKLAVEEAIAGTNTVTLSTIIGTVVEQNTNTPLSGVLVQATKAGSTAIEDSTSTSASGGFMLMLEPNTTYNLKFTKAGYEEQIQANVALADSPLTLSDVSMSLNTTQGTITGRVIEQGTNAPLAGVLVEVTRGSSSYLYASTTTNASGEYSLALNTVGTYNLKFTKSNYFEQVQANVNFTGLSMTLSDVLLVLTPFAGGLGIAEDPYLISTPDQLNAIRDYLSAHYKLINDIDLASWGNWEPINYFTGVFDGDGNTIKNMTVSSYVYFMRADDDVFSTKKVVAGLFGCLGYRNRFSYIRNVGLVNSVVDVSNGPSAILYAGSIVGYIYSGRIDNCYTTTNVTITTGSLAYAGGIFGYGTEQSRIANSYSTGTVKATSSYGAYAGGIAGGIGSSIHDNCYSLDNIHISDYTGFNGIRLTDTQMKQQASFVGFDFTNVWAISPAINNGYPYLRGMQP